MLNRKRRRNLFKPPEVLISKIPLNIYPVPGMTITGGGPGAVYFQQHANAFDDILDAAGVQSERFVSLSNDTNHEMTMTFDSPVNLSLIEWYSELNALGALVARDLKVSINDGPFNFFTGTGKVQQWSFSPTMVNKLKFSYTGAQGTFGINGSTVNLSEIKLLGPKEIITSTVELLFNDNANPWLDTGGHVFTKVGSGPSVANGQMTNVQSINNYITTPDAPELRLTGDFTLKVGIRDWNMSLAHASLFSKGNPNNGTFNAGQIYLYGTNTLYVCSDNGGAVNDIISSMTLPLVSGNLDLTLVRKVNTMYVYAGVTLVGTAAVASNKTFGNNASPLNINGGNLAYTVGLQPKLDYWTLTKGASIVPTVNDGFDFSKAALGTGIYGTAAFDGQLVRTNGYEFISNALSSTGIHVPVVRPNKTGKRFIEIYVSKAAYNQVSMVGSNAPGDTPKISKASLATGWHGIKIDYDLKTFHVDDVLIGSFTTNDEFVVYGNQGVSVKCNRGNDLARQNLPVGFEWL